MVRFAEYQIDAALTRDGVIACPAPECVIIGTPKDGVITAIAKRQITPCLAVDHVGAIIRAPQDIVTRAAV